jgi:hypothetical protein
MIDKGRNKDDCRQYDHYRNCENVAQHQPPGGAPRPVLFCSVLFFKEIHEFQSPVVVLEHRNYSEAPEYIVNRTGIAGDPCRLQ